MANILFKRIAPTAHTYTILNFTSLNFELNTPVSPMPLPEEDKLKAILVKMEGNTMAMSVAWTINDEASSVVNTSTVATAEKQREFLLDTMEYKSIEDKFTLESSGLSPEWSYVGVPTKLSLQKTSDSPITYSATLDYIIGDVITISKAEEEDD